MTLWRRFGLSTTARLVLVACVALLAVNALAFFFYTLPKSLESRNRSELVSQLRQEVQQLRTQIETRRASVATRVANVRDEGRFLGEVAAARQPDLLATITEIREIAQASGVTVPSWSFDDKPMSDAPIDAFEITVPVEGNYDRLVAFLEGLQRSKHFLAVDELRLAGGEGNQVPRLEIKLSAFFRSKVAA